MNKKKPGRTVMQMLDDLLEDVPRTNIDMSGEPVPVQTITEVTAEYEDDENDKAKKSNKKLK